jgi:hypothetical protein
VIVVGDARAFEPLVDRTEREDKLVIDLVRVDRQRSSNGQYQGLCW